MKNIFENKPFYIKWKIMGNKFSNTFLELVFSCLFLSCNPSIDQENESPIQETPIQKQTEIVITPIEKGLITQGLVDVQVLDPSIKVNLKYSTEDNFFGQDVYGDFNKAYLQEKPAVALKLAQYLLKKKNPNLSLLVYDAARPLSIQKILWNSLDTIPPKKRKDFVADPVEGSIHNYGCAIDLTLFDIKANKEIDMGTPYDYFGYKAYPRLETQMLINGQLDSSQINNRKLLRDIMETAGFEAITSEWWHFNFYSRERAKRVYKIVE